MSRKQVKYFENFSGFATAPELKPSVLGFAFKNPSDYELVDFFSQFND